jgi:ribosomal protein L11 methyltransferase
MIYKAVRLFLDPPREELSEILFALLDAFAFEGISEENDSLVAYVAEDKYREDALQEAEARLKALNCNLSWTSEDVPEQNWNAIWESNFEPVIIDKRCGIRAPFHPPFTAVPYEIIIEPKMSFGTGHHQTTQLMVTKMLDLDFTGKCVLDMGCGTGVLAILAHKLGAGHITAIDVDTWAFENTLENIRRNNCHDIRVMQGSVESIPRQKYDIILANINRNILVDQIPVYTRHLSGRGFLLLSGIMTDDEQVIRQFACINGFAFIEAHEMGKWLMMIFQRN